MKYSVVVHVRTHTHISFTNMAIDADTHTYLCAVIYELSVPPQFFINVANKNIIFHTSPHEKTLLVYIFPIKMHLND